jgi:hypothetical protein
VFHKSRDLRVLNHHQTNVHNMLGITLSLHFVISVPIREMHRIRVLADFHHKRTRGPTAFCRGTPVLTRPLYIGWRGNAKGTMVEGAGTEEPEILRGDRQGLKPDYELDALRGAEAPLFHFRAQLPLSRRCSPWKRKVEVPTLSRTTRQGWGTHWCGHALQRAPLRMTNRKADPAASPFLIISR